jgi:hypothetical protein
VIFGLKKTKSFMLHVEVMLASISLVGIVYGVTVMQEKYGTYTCAQAAAAGTLSGGYVYGAAAFVKGTILTDLATIDPTKDWGIVIDFKFRWVDTNLNDVWYFNTIWDPNTDQQGDWFRIDRTGIPNPVRFIYSTGRTGITYDGAGGWWVDTAWASASLPRR